LSQKRWGIIGFRRRRIIMRSISELQEVSE